MFRIPIHLNYQVKLSPFSAIISLKKSLVKDKSGRPILPSSFSFAPNEDTEILHDKLLKVESYFSSLQRAYETVSFQYVEKL